MTTLGAEWNFTDFILATLWFFLIFIWIWLLITVFADIFRSKDLGGWGKAGWMILVFILPWLGALIYFIARGGSMHERDAQQARDSQAAMDAYISERVKEVRPAASASPVDELAKLAELHKSGAISDDEFAAMKAKVLAVMCAKTFDDALREVNASAYKLTGGVFSRTPSHLERARNELRVGNLYINRGITGARVGRQPFGGFGMSGLGSQAGGPHYLLHFVEPRSVCENTMRRGFAPEL